MHVRRTPQLLAYYGTKLRTPAGSTARRGRHSRAATLLCADIACMSDCRFHSPLKPHVAGRRWTGGGGGGGGGVRRSRDDRDMRAKRHIRSAWQQRHLNKARSDQLVRPRENCVGFLINDDAKDTSHHLDHSRQKKHRNQTVILCASSIKNTYGMKHGPHVYFKKKYIRMSTSTLSSILQYPILRS